MDYKGIRDEDDELVFPEMDALDFEKALRDMKYILFLTLCRAPRDSMTHFDIWKSWNMVDDPMIRQRLMEDNILEQVDSLKKMGESHWYRMRLEVGDLVERSIASMVASVHNDMEDIEKGL